MAPKHLQDLADEGYELPTYREAQAWFARRGVSVGYSHLRRSWFFMAMGRPGGPTTVICWAAVGAFVEMLEAPSATLKTIAEQGGDVKPV